MKVKAIIIIALLCIALISCDRYTIELESPKQDQDFTESFSIAAMNLLRANNADSLVTAYFSEDYLNNGKNFEDMHDLFSRDWSPNVIVNVSVLVDSVFKMPSTAYIIEIRDGDFHETWYDFYEPKLLKASENHWIGDQQENVEEFVVGFTFLFNTLLPDNTYIPQIRNYYTDTYMHDAFDYYTGIDGFFRSHEWTSQTNFSITPTHTFNQYIITVSDDGIEDKVWTDNLFFSDSFKWIGNGVSTINTEEQFVTYFIERGTEYLRGDDIDSFMMFFSRDYANGLNDYTYVEEMFRSRTWSPYALVSAASAMSGVPGSYMIIISDHSVNDEFFRVWNDYIGKPQNKYVWVGVPESEEQFIRNFTDRVTTYLRENNIAPILSFYAEDYQNGSYTLVEMEEYYRSRQWTSVANVRISPVTTRNVARLEVTVTDEDYSYTWIDVAENRSYKYYWVGNQPQAVPNQIVLIETFTGIFCNYCPLASDKLHDISEIYPDKFIYIEYFSRNGDPMGLYSRFQRERTYYNTNNQEPFTVFHGVSTISGTGPNHSYLDNYQPRIENLINQKATIVINNLDGSIDGDTVSGSVTLTIYEPNTQNLYLHYAIYEEYVQDKEFYYYPEIPVSHAVRARDFQALTDPQSGDTVSFSFQIPPNNDFPVDTDLVLVVWVQRRQNSTNYTVGDKVFYAVKKALY